MSRSGFLPLDLNPSDVVPALHRALFRLEALSVGRVVDDSLTVPPGSPAEDSVYIIPSGGAAGWGQPDHTVAHYYASSWHYYTPNPLAATQPAYEWIIYVASSGNRVRWNGISWVNFP